MGSACECDFSGLCQSKPVVLFEPASTAMGNPFARVRPIEKHMVDDIFTTRIPTPAVTFDPVGRCIYCGATGVDLRDEHIVPLSLNGTMILPRASCRECEKITTRFERSVARNMYG